MSSHVESRSVPRYPLGDEWIARSVARNAEELRKALNGYAALSEVLSVLAKQSPFNHASYDTHLHKQRLAAAEVVGVASVLVDRIAELPAFEAPTDVSAPATS